MSFAGLLIDYVNVWRSTATKDNMGGHTNTYTKIGRYRCRLDSHMSRLIRGESGSKIEADVQIFFPAGVSLLVNDVVVEQTGERRVFQLWQGGPINGATTVHHVEWYAKLLAATPTGVS